MTFRTVALVILALGVLVAWGNSALVADDPLIKEAVRVNVQEAILRTIDAGTVGGVYRLYDPLTGNLLRLKFTRLHSEISKKGNFYVNCADFKDIYGRVVDVDFLVLSDGDEMRVTLAVVHKLGVKNRPAFPLTRVLVLWVRVGPQQWAAVTQYGEDILCHWRAEKLREGNRIATCLPRVVSLSSGDVL